MGVLVRSFYVTFTAMKTSSTIAEVVRFLERDNLSQAMACLELIAHEQREVPSFELASKTFFKRALSRADVEAASEIAWAAGLPKAYAEEEAEAAANILEKAGDSDRATQIRERFLPVGKFVMDQNKVKKMLEDSFLEMALSSEFDAFGRAIPQTFYQIKEEKALPETITAAMKNVTLQCLEGGKLLAALMALQEAPEVQAFADVQAAARTAYHTAVQNQWDIAENIKKAFGLE